MGATSDETLVFERTGAGGQAHAVEAVQGIRAAWRQYQPGALFYLRAHEGGELHIVADGDADPSPSRVEHARRRAWRHAPAFGFEAGHGPLVLEGDAAVRIDQWRAVVHRAWRGAHRHAAWDQPDAVTPGEVGEQGEQARLQRTYAGKLGLGVTGARAEGGSFHAGIFGQHEKVRATGRALCHQGLQLGRVSVEAGRGCDVVLAQGQAQGAHGRGAPVRDFSQNTKGFSVSFASPRSFQDMWHTRSGRRV